MFVRQKLNRPEWRSKKGTYKVVGAQVATDMLRGNIRKQLDITESQ